MMNQESELHIFRLWVTLQYDNLLVFKERSHRLNAIIDFGMLFHKKNNYVLQEYDSFTMIEILDIQILIY